VVPALPVVPAAPVDPPPPPAAPSEDVLPSFVSSAFEEQAASATQNKARRQRDFMGER
jgi:hypothetical protein